jgi:hypothetical protein
MPPVTRRYARLLGELDSVLRKGKNLVEEIRRLELESQALAHAKGTPVSLPVRNSGKDFIVTDHEEGR